ncbi:alpha/beta fold hydrolase [Arthrobacter sp. GCM10027362]|uniref:alpha/beta fold hydrolase n=1 Tax=Arthrobacter sp. GCM10027362 TaxID=3273379 RepID=UPI003638332C
MAETRDIKTHPFTIYGTERAMRHPRGAHMKTVAINDIQVAYSETAGSDTGDGPVVLIHGLAEGRDSWSGTQADLSGLHTFAYDLRGHGATTTGEGAGTLEQLGQDLVGFLEQVTGPAIVVGFSLGGTVALWAAAERPDLVRRTVVLGTSSLVGRSAVQFYVNRIEMAGDTTSREFRNAIRDDTAAALYTATDELDVVTKARLAAIGDGTGYVNAARAMAALHESPLTPRLADITTHVDVIGADHDAFCPAKAARIIVDALSDVTYREVPNAGHLMNVDNPSAVTAVLREAIAGRN